MTPRRWLTRQSALLLFGTALIVACVVETEAAESRCTPGNSVLCLCKDRSHGTKKCLADGNSFEPCSQCNSGVDDEPGSSSGSSGEQFDAFVPEPLDAASTTDGAQTTCSGKPNGSPCGPGADACHAKICVAGQCTGAGVRPDGVNWAAGDDTARCCGGNPVKTNTNDNCGVCGAKCAGAQTCQPLGGRWFCRGCDQNPDCWTGCCSKAFGLGTCAASDCGPSNSCKQAVCPANATCALGQATSSNYCKY